MAKRMSNSERLERENLKMEMQLNKLRTQIEQEKVRSSGDASFWKSAAPQRGGLRSFGHSVRTKSKTKKELKAEQARGWSKSDVAEWLSSIELDKCRDVFRENEINGEVLMELGIDDLDYMGITALGTRKLILKEIAKIKQTIDPSERPMSRGGIINHSISKPTLAVESLIEETKYNDTPSLQFGQVDEAAEQEAFRKAVEEWRNSENSEKRTAVGSCGGSFYQGELDEQEEHIQFQNAVNAWRNAGEDVEITNYQSHKAHIKALRDEQKQKLVDQFENDLQNSKPMLSPRSELEEKVVESEAKEDFSSWDFESAF